MKKPSICIKFSTFTCHKNYCCRTETTVTTATSEASSDIETRIRVLKEQLKKRREEVKKSQQEQKRKKKAVLKQKELELKRKLQV